MDIHSIPESFQSKIRLAVIAALVTGDKTFNQIKEVTGATDGNLSVHLTRLEEMNYIRTVKEFVAKKPRTTYSLTNTGRRELEEYVDLLEALLKGAKPDK